MKKVEVVIFIYVTLFIVSMFGGVLKGPDDLAGIFRLSIIFTLVLGTIFSIIYLVQEKKKEWK